MNEIRKKSAIPIYGAAAAYAIYSIVCPLYKMSHFLWGALITVGVYLLLSKLIPDTVITVEKEPEYTGDEIVDELLKTGRNTVSEIRTLCGDIKNETVSAKAGRIADLTEKIFDYLCANPSDYQQVKHFSDYFLPATTKLLTSYRDMEAQNAGGVNIDGTMNRIDDILDTTAAAYEKQLDALFARQALDIETDITVMRGMMRNQGLADSDFDL